jgi:hypothetical protein
MSGGSHKRRPFNADLSQETGKNQLIPGQKSMGDASVLSHRFLLIKP